MDKILITNLNKLKANINSFLGNAVIFEFEFEEGKTEKIRWAAYGLFFISGIIFIKVWKLKILGFFLLMSPVSVVAVWLSCILILWICSNLIYLLLSLVLRLFYIKSYINNFHIWITESIKSIVQNIGIAFNTFKRLFSYYMKNILSIMLFIFFSIYALGLYSRIYALLFGIEQ